MKAKKQPKILNIMTSYIESSKRDGKLSKMNTISRKATDKFWRLGKKGSCYGVVILIGLWVRKGQC